MLTITTSPRAAPTEATTSARLGAGGAFIAACTLNFKVRRRAGGIGGEQDVKSLKSRCSAEVLVPGGRTAGSLTVGALLDTGSGMTCVSESLVAKIELRLPGQQLIFSLTAFQPRLHVAGGRQVRIYRQTR